MDPRLDSRERELRDRARAVATDVVLPRAAELDATATLPPGLVAVVADGGLLAAGMPGPGAPAGLFPLILVVEEMARASASFGAVVAGHAVAAIAVAEAAEADGTSVPDGLREGTLRAAFAGDAGETLLDDPGPGAAATAVGDTFRLDGELAAVTGAVGAGVFLVPARLSGDRVGLFLVEAGADGLEVGEEEPRLGLNGSGTATVTLHDVAARPLAVGEGAAVLRRPLDVGRLVHAAVSVGIAQAALDACIGMVAGAEERVARSQSVQWMLADTATETEAARLLGWYAASRTRADELTEAAAMARTVAAATAADAARRAVQIFGRRGGLRAVGVERLYRDAKAMEIHEGASEAQRRVVARHLLPDLVA